MTALLVTGVPVNGSSPDGVYLLYSVVQKPVSPYPTSHLSADELTCWQRAERGFQWKRCRSTSGTIAGLLAVRILASDNSHLIQYGML